MKKQLLILLLFLSFISVHAQALTATSTITQPLCFGDSNGAITVLATGGTAQYTFSLMQNGITLIAVGPSNVFSYVFTNLSAGNYTVIVTDGSTPTQQVNLTVTLAQPSPLTVATTVSGNTITVLPSGGNAPYQFSLNPGVPFQTSPVFSGVEQGNHLLTVIDMNGCVVNTIVTVSPILNIQGSSDYVDYNGDGFVNVGDVVNYQFVITNIDGTTPVEWISLHANGLVVNGSIAMLSPGASDTTSFSATHVITQQDINNQSISFNFYARGIFTDIGILSNNISVVQTLLVNDGINLNAFVDTNANGIQDSGEQNFTQGNFQYQINNDGINHNITNSTGVHYLYEVNPANFYDLSYSIGNVSNPSQYSLGTSSYSNVTVASGSGITTYNFPVTVLPHKDLEVLVISNGVPPRPGFTYVNRLVYKNNGNQTIDSGILTFTKDNAVTVTNISQSGTVSTANGFTYDFVNLLPGEVRYIDVTMQVPTIPTVALGQTVTNNFLATISGTDINASNNASSLTQTIVGSYDPNDKIESHGGKILHSSFTSNDYLTYTIQFENTGTANAVNVRVNDVLDSKLDETTVRMINASHDYALDRVGNNLNWKFNGIELEPSVANTAIGKGYVTFQIKPKPGYVIGDIIPNTASIYFDFNPAIVTNTFNTEFVSTLSIANFESESFAVYPNPTSGVLTILSKNSSRSINNVVVSDVLGKTVQTNSFNSSKVVLDLSGLDRGVYFVKVQSEGVDKIMKVVKQ